MADALSHVTLAGIAFGLFVEKQFLAITISPIYSGMTFSVLGAIAIEKLRSIYKSYAEIGIPVILSGGVGLSVVFISRNLQFIKHKIQTNPTLRDNTAGMHHRR